MKPNRRACSWLMDKKAVSEAVGAMLMIALTVTAGGIVYVYSSGIMGSLQGSQPQQPYLEQVTLDYYKWYCSSSSCGSGNVVLILRNSGTKPVTLADFFIAGNRVSNPCSSNCPTTINVGSAYNVTLAYSGLALYSGYSYNVKVVTNDGAIFSFPCIAGNIATS